MRTAAEGTAVAELHDAADKRFLSAFWSRVDKDGPVVRAELGPCWQWIGRVNDGGYGQVRFRGRHTYVHRIAWFLAHGSVPQLIDRVVGPFVLHRCDNPRCVNHAHLFLGTQADNIADRDRKGRNSHQRGTQKQRTKLTPAEVAAIAAEIAAGQSVRATARRFGVHAESARKIARGERWKTIEREPIAAQGKPSGSPATRAERARRAARRAKGQCIECGAPAEPERTRCAKHLLKNRAHQLCERPYLPVAITQREA